MQRVPPFAPVLDTLFPGGGSVLGGYGTFGKGSLAGGSGLLRGRA